MTDPHICTCGDCEFAPYRDRCKYEITLATLRDAVRLVVDAEYRRERLGPDTVATFGRAIEELRKAWERTG